MRGSDIVIAVFEVSPRRLVQVVIVGLAIGAVVFGWTEPIEWFINDVAAGVHDLFMQLWEPYLERLTNPSR